MSTGRKPRVGITRSAGRDFGAHLFQELSVRIAGGEPVALTEGGPGDAEELDALVIPGGPDIHPDHYQGRLKRDYRYDPGRDRLELTWIERAERLGLPVLGICRGVQIMNVARGGSLYPDVRDIHDPSDYPGAGVLPALFFRKRIFLEPDTLMARLVERKSFVANALNTQAINVVGEGFDVSGRESNGTVQIVEDPGRRFFLGVQYHPEFLPHRSASRRLFAGLLRAVRERLG